jgi:phenylacetate-CoA ligase
VGRKNHKLKIKGTTLFPSTLQVVLDSCEDVASYVIVARREDDLSDSLEIKVCWNAASADKALPALRERLRGEAKVSPRITESSAGEIERLQMPEGSRKRRFFVDLRAGGSC